MFHQKDFLYVLFMTGFKSTRTKIFFTDSDLGEFVVQHCNTHSFKVNGVNVIEEYLCICIFVWKT